MRAKALPKSEQCRESAMLQTVFSPIKGVCTKPNGHDGVMHYDQKIGRRWKGADPDWDKGEPKPLNIDKPERCDPNGEWHTTPHKGCILR